MEDDTSNLRRRRLSESGQKYESLINGDFVLIDHKVKSEANEKYPLEAESLFLFNGKNLTSSKFVEDVEATEEAKQANGTAIEMKETSTTKNQTSTETNATPRDLEKSPRDMELKSTNGQIRPERGLVKQQGRVQLEETVVSERNGKTANGIAEAKRGIDGQAEGRLSLAAASPMKAPLHEKQFSSALGLIPFGSLQQAGSPADSFVSNTASRARDQRIDSDNSARGRLSLLHQVNQKPNHTGGINIQPQPIESEPRQSEAESNASESVERRNNEAAAQYGDAGETYQNNDGTLVKGSTRLSDHTERRPVADSGKRKATELDSDKQSTICTEENTAMEGDIDVETNSDESRANSPDPTAGGTQNPCQDAGGPEDLSVKGTKRPLQDGPGGSTAAAVSVPCRAERLQELASVSSAKCIKIEPILSPYHQNYRCSPPGLQMVAPPTSAAPVVGASRFNPDQRQSMEEPKTLVIQQPHSHHPNTTVINYGRPLVTANNGPGKICINGQRGENGQSPAAGGYVNGPNKDIDNTNNANGSVPAKTMEMDPSRPVQFRDGARGGNSGDLKTDEERKVGSDESDLHIVVDRDMSDAEETGERRLGASSGTAQPAAAQHAGLPAERPQHRTEDGPPRTPDADALNRDSASAKDSDEVNL